MKTESKVVLLEFNELSPALMDNFLKQGKLPNFAKVYNESHIFLTRAKEIDYSLQPWIQWVTVHTGLNYEDHGVYRLGEGHKIKAPRIWDVTAEHGLRNLLVGSMNMSLQKKPNEILILPDPWSNKLEPYPPEIQPFFQFTRSVVLEHTNPTRKISIAQLLRFLWFMATHGLSFETVRKIFKQVALETVNGNTWKRVAILDALQLDFFRSYYMKLSPHFATFFLNSTAHLQHLYWRNMDPSLFEIKPTEQEQKKNRDAILFGYQSMDSILAKFLNFIDENTTLVFATAISQQPFLNNENTGGKILYRPYDLEKLINFAGVKDPHRCEPVMAEQFYVHFDSETAAQANSEKLSAVQLAGSPALHVAPNRSSIFVGCKIFHQVEKAMILKTPFGERREAPFFELFYQIEGMKSGAHHPDGMLWIRTPNRVHQIHSEPVALSCVAPTLLKLLNLQPPSSMVSPSLKIESFS